MKVAVVDLGTNTCRLLLGQVEQGVIVALAARETTVVRLGQGVDQRGRLAAEAVARTRRCLDGYAPRIAGYRPERTLLIATSVLRDAADGVSFLDAVRSDHGLPWRVLSGEEEGRLAFLGATAAFPGLTGEVAVMDIGGGSTEFAAGAAGGGRRPHFVVSLDVGAVRLTERFLSHDPPTDEEWAAAETHTRAVLESGVPPAARVVTCLIGVAGTVTTLVANKLGLRVYRSELVAGQDLRLSDIEAAIGAFRRLTSAQRGRLPGIQPGREDVILAGALIAWEGCRLYGRDRVLCGESDILEGAALWLADAG
jgi:exopolyphosphatase/guanosine-5'-triphosphate,3'-diphosphate pyrophosphatase